jgi:predicted DNA-binding transcriptional regulator AlpA
VSEFIIEILFEGLAQDDSLDEALAEVGVITAEPADADSLRLTAAVVGQNAVQAAVSFISDVMAAAPGARPIMAERDLVNTTDIADRCGVSREAVRNWVKGRRRQGRFPREVGSPGGQKVWEWGSVSAWLELNLRIGDGLLYPTHAEFADIDAHIKNVRSCDGDGAVSWHQITTTRKQQARFGAHQPPMASSLPSDWTRAS